MELHQLKYAVAVAKHRNFTVAAEELWISRSTLSEQIRKLEGELGLSLFARTTRSVEVTAAGETFVAGATTMLSQLSALMLMMGEHRSVERGRIVLGTPPTYAIAQLPAILAGMRRDYPGVAIHLREAPTNQLVELLMQRHLEMSILSMPEGADYPDLAQLELVRSRTAVGLSSRHPLAKRRSLELRELAGTPLVLHSPGFAMREITLEVCKRAGLKFEVAFESAIAHTIGSMIAEELGFSIVTAERARAQGISFIPCLPKPRERVVTLAWLANTPLSAAAQILRNRVAVTFGLDPALQTVYEAERW